MCFLDANLRLMCEGGVGDTLRGLGILIICKKPVYSPAVLPLLLRLAHWLARQYKVPQ